MTRLEIFWFATVLIITVCAAVRLMRPRRSGP